MKRIVLASRKGGAGKTTLAVHLAVEAGPHTALIDLDPQASASLWFGIRKAGTDWPLSARAELDALPGLIDQAQGEGIKTLFLDTPPHADATAGLAMRGADLVLIPVRPALFDLDAARVTVQTARNNGVPAVAVLSACRPKRGIAEAPAVADARGFLAEEVGVTVWPGQITQLQPYADALNGGTAVTEYDPSGRAAQEIRTLWTWIKRTMGPGKK